MSMKLSVSARIVEKFRDKRQADLGLVELADLAASAGYSALYMRASQLGTQTPIDQVHEQYQLLVQRGLEVSMVTGDFPIPENTDDGPQALRNIAPYLDLAAALHCDLMRIAMKTEEDIQWAQRAADEANERGIRLAHQCHTASLFERVDAWGVPFPGRADPRGASQLRHHLRARESRSRAARTRRGGAEQRALAALYRIVRRVAPIAGNALRSPAGRRPLADPAVRPGVRQQRPQSVCVRRSNPDPRQPVSTSALASERVDPRPRTPAQQSPSDSAQSGAQLRFGWSRPGGISSRQHRRPPSRQFHWHRCSWGSTATRSENGASKRRPNR